MILSVASFALGACSGGTPPPAPPAPAVIEAALLAAEEYFGQNDLGKAKTILTELLQQAPAEPRAHEKLGQVLYEEWVVSGDPSSGSPLVQAACDHYLEAVEHAAGTLAPVAEAGLRQSAGEIASAAARYEDALELFRTAGVLDPTNAKSSLHEAQILLILKRDAEADAALRCVLTLDPDEPYAHASFAALAMRRDDTGAAIAHIEEARRIDAYDLGLRVQEAKIRCACDDPWRGITLLKSLDPALRAERVVADQLAACYMAAGEPVQAARTWEHRHRTHGAWIAAVRAGEAWLEAGDREEALYWLKIARLSARDAPEVKALEEAMGN